MPAKVKVRILAGRNLPVMDKSSDASDAFVEVKLGNTTYKTEVYRRSLNPFWNSEWFRFEVSDQELQDEPLQVRIMDYDTYSANDAIGKVYINLNPLLVNSNKSMSGWLPIYDTLHGIRGEINCMVKVNMFADNNRFRHSSCGVRFFFSDIPNGYRCDAILGFIDELLVNDDPEYQWIDKIRTPRASNEARQTLFTKLSGEVQRKLGLKAEILGGNAVIGYQQSFDLEGGSGIVGRGIGTAVVLSKIGSPYERIMSPLMNDRCDLYPYSSSATRDRHSRNPINRRNVTTSHSLMIRKSHSPGKQLVHSVSADYFYEVPNIVSNDKSANTPCESSHLPASLALYDFLSGDDTIDELSDLSLTEIDGQDDNPDDLENIPVDAVRTAFNNSSLSSSKRRLLFSLMKPMKLSQSVESAAPSSRLDSKRKLSAPYSLISKLTLSKGYNIPKRLAAVVSRPLSSSSLTKLVSFSRYAAQNNHMKETLNQNIVDLCDEHEPRDRDRDMMTKRLAQSNKSSGDDSMGLGQQRSNTTSSGSISPSTSQTSSGVTQQSSLNHKRKINPSQSASVEDALSIIEEKLDDDDAQAQTTLANSPKARARVFSESGGRSRQIERTQEVELDDSSANKFMLPKTAHSVANLSSPSAQAASRNTFSQSDSAASLTESPSVETIKAKQPEIEHAIATQSMSIEHADRASATSGLKRYSPDSKDISNRQNPNNRSNCDGTRDNNNFVQSVRVIKAQQHLLHNMIKYQNQNLVHARSQKMRSVFIYPNRLYQSEYPFVTFKRFPETMIGCTGGVVSVHSVKLLDHIINDEESETRDIWWTEVRKEINCHAKALNCNTIIGYKETSKVLGDVCVLSAYGTAAVMKYEPDNQRPNSPDNPYCQPSLVSGCQTLKIPNGFSGSPPLAHASMPTTSESQESQSQQQNLEPLDPTAATTTTTTTTTNRSQQQFGDHQNTPANNNTKDNPQTEVVQIDKLDIDCSFCHSPLICAETVSSLANCSICNSSKVPDLLLLTIEPPPNLNIASKGTLVQARVCRAKRDSHGEASAKEIGEALPFLEYELHRQLYSKLKFKAMNCLYNLDIDISIGENMISGIATGTGCFVLGLPTPEPPRISGGKGTRASKLLEIQKLIETSAQKNRENLGLDSINSQLAVLNNEQQQQQQPQQSSSRSPSPMLCSLDPDTQQRKPDEANVNLELTPKSDHHYHSSNHSHHHHHHHTRHHRHHHRSRTSSNHGEYSGSRGANSDNLLYDDNNIVLEVDDNQDANIIALLIDSDIPDGYTVLNSESTPLIDQSSFVSMNMFTKVMRAKLTALDQFAHLFDWVLQALFVKLRRSLPCCLTNLMYIVDLPESNVVQVSITGCLLSLSKQQQQALEASGETSRRSTRQFKAATEATSTSASPHSSSSTSSASSSLSSVSERDAPTNPNQKTSSYSSPSSTSFKSVKENTTAIQVASVQSQAPTQSTSGARSSLSKQLSKSNIASLISSTRANLKSAQSPTIDKKRTSASVGIIEHSTSEQRPTVGRNRLGNTYYTKPAPSEFTSPQEPVRFMRTVFKKQQTYPGALSPVISGQDSKLSTADDTIKSTESSQSTSVKTRKATLIFNKVKQPLKDLGSNLNATASSTNQTIAPETIDMSQMTSKLTRPNDNATSSTATHPSSTLRVVAPAIDIMQQTSNRIQHYKRASDRAVNSSAIDISSLSYVPGAKEYNYLGNLSFSFVRETGSVRENGGLNGFIHCFLMEVYAIVRAHVSALGGNAFLSLRLQQSCIFYHSNKNQAQCLISVAGDAVQITM